MAPHPQHLSQYVALTFVRVRVRVREKTIGTVHITCTRTHIIDLCVPNDNHCATVWSINKMDEIAEPTCGQAAGGEATLKRHQMRHSVPVFGVIGRTSM